MDTLLDGIAEHLFLNSGFTAYPGLSNGKAGISLFMYHYSLYSGARRYRLLARELLCEAFAMTGETPVKSFLTGTAGVGWAAEYLMQKDGTAVGNPGAADAGGADFSVADLGAIDEAVYGFSYQAEWGFRDGLAGYMLYLQSRMRQPGNAVDDMDAIVRQEIYIAMVDRLERKLRWKYGPNNDGLAELIVTGRFRAADKHAEIANYGRTITTLARGLARGIYPEVTLALIGRMVDAVRLALDRAAGEGTDAADEQLMRLIAQIELSLACWNAGGYCGNGQWQALALSQMRRVLERQMSLLEGMVRQPARLHKTLPLVQVVTRMRWAAKEEVFREACERLGKCLGQMTALFIEKGTDDHLGLAGGLAGIGMTVLSAVDVGAVSWDEWMAMG